MPRHLQSGERPTTKQAISRLFQNAKQKRIADRKASDFFSSLFTAAATPEKGVVAANLSQLALVREAGFAKGCNVDSVASEFSGYEVNSTFWSF